MITVEDKKYVVIENMGFIHDRGAYGKVIDFNGEERIVLKVGRTWEFAKPMVLPASKYIGQSSKVVEAKDD